MPKERARARESERKREQERARARESERERERERERGREREREREREKQKKDTKMADTGNLFCTFDNKRSFSVNVPVPSSVTSTTSVSTFQLNYQQR
jgi:hypothetical protein